MIVPHVLTLIVSFFSTLQQVVGGWLCANQTLTLQERASSSTRVVEELSAVMIRGRHRIEVWLFLDGREGVSR